MILCVEICKYNYMFFTKPYKILPFSKWQKQRNKQNNKNSISRIFHFSLQEVVCVVSVCSLAPKLLQLYQIVIGQKMYSCNLRIYTDKNIFSLKSAKNRNI